jgi:ABC-type oligopeptide transport system ATPase subunit
MIEVNNLQKTFPGTHGLLSHDAVKALRGVTFLMRSGGAVSVFCG